MNLLLLCRSSIFDKKFQSSNISRNQTKLMFIQCRQCNSLLRLFPDCTQCQLNNRMHLTIPKDTRSNINIDGETACPTPMNSLVKSLSEFKEGEIVDPTNFTFIIV